MLIKLRKKKITETEKARRAWFIKQYGIALKTGMITTVPKRTPRKHKIKI